jgi:hypothetical protein
MIDNSSDKLSENCIPTILRAVIYYDIFHYPLTYDDISYHCGLSQEKIDDFNNALDFLVEKKIIYKLGDYYSVNDSYSTVERRIKGNKEAEKWIIKARRFSRFIASFPFVRGVAVSGSLSKGFVGEDPDIDYFIITKPNRLWLARTILIAFKKIFLFNSYKYFCLNYFIVQDNLEIEEKNLFTATEITTMMPVFGKNINNHFFEKNQWISAFYPNFNVDDLKGIPVNNAKLPKRIIEFFLGGKFGNAMDDYFMNITIKHWTKKYRQGQDDNEFNLSFKSGKNVSKHHPQNFQKKVLNRFKNKVKEIEETHNLDLSNIIVELN